MFRWTRSAMPMPGGVALASGAYAGVVAVALLLAHAFGRGSLLRHESPWLPLAGLESHAFSLLLGAAFAALVVVGTRVLVASVGWAKKLHGDLRPLTFQLDGGGILAIAALSAVAEELVFRGLLLPLVGLLPQALIFGVVHAQLSGPSRWVWVAWASVVGLALGGVFALTGSLLGPVLAHALINGLNLLYLKSYDPAPPPHSLGGLLSDRRSPVPERPSPVPAGRRA